MAFPDIIEKDDKETIAQLQSQVADLTTKINEITNTLKQHKHSGSDGSQIIDQTLEIRSPNTIKLGYGEIGSYGIRMNTPLETTQTSISAGDDIGDFVKSGNAQLNLIHNGEDVTNYVSYFAGFRPPLYTSFSTVSITNGGNTLTTGQHTWATNELAGSYVNINDGVGNVETRVIASNTATTITISGTWTSTTGNYYYTVWRPIYLGWSEFPWRRIYVADDIRFGVGASSGTGVLFIKYGAGTPEGVIAANVGSLYLRTDGSTSTTLYVKTSGTGKTGWTAK